MVSWIGLGRLAPEREPVYVGHRPPRSQGPRTKATDRVPTPMVGLFILGGDAGDLAAGIASAPSASR